MIKLYHGSWNKNLDSIEDVGLFEGLFFSCSSAIARSHGDEIYYINLREEEILTQYDLNHHLDYEKVSLIINKYIENVTPMDFDIVWSFIVEDKSVYDSYLYDDRINEIFRTNDLAETSWKAQKIRGAIAKHFGYKAVEMKDEHGTTYLVLPGVPLTKLGVDV